MDPSVFKFTQGQAFSVELKVENSDGTVCNLTGKTVTFSCKRNVLDNDPTPDLVKTLTGGTSQGLVTLSLTNVETSNLREFGHYWFELKIETGGLASFTGRQLFKVISPLGEN